MNKLSDTIEDFTVDFALQYFTVGNSLQSNAASPTETLIS